jgi:hypothetical protein
MDMKVQNLFGRAPKADPEEFVVQNKETGTQKILTEKCPFEN